MQNAHGSAAARIEAPSVEPLPEAPKAPKKRQRRETLEQTDARKRKKRRRNWRELARQSDRRWVGAPPSQRRYRAAELVLSSAAIARATPEAFELLGQARDGDGRRLLSPSALRVLRSYMADAELEPRDDGWLRVPAVQTQRQRADALDLTDRTLRNVNRDLAAAGLLCPGEMIYCGDGVRVIRKRGGGDDYCLELKRRVWLLAPAVAEMLGAPRASKAGNQIPAAFPEGAAFASPEVEAPPIGGAEIDQTLPPSTVLYPHDLHDAAWLEEQAQTAVPAGNDEPAAASVERSAASGGAEGRELAPEPSTAGKGLRALTVIAPSVPAAERAGGGDLQGRLTGGRRPRRRRR